MYQLLETSDIPEGYINILTSKQDSLNKIFLNMKILTVYGYLVKVIMKEKK